MVQYSVIRDNIQNGDIIFFRNNSWVSKLIQFVTHSKFSHVGIAVWIDTGISKRLMICEAQGKTKRRILNLSFYISPKYDITLLRIPLNWNEIEPKALEKLGTVSYGWLEAIYVGIREFLLKSFNINLPYKDFPGEICSEYVAKVLDLPTIHISPQLLYEQLQKQKTTEEKIIAD